MRTAGPWLLVGWLVAALLVLAMDGRLPAFLAAAVPGSLLVLGVGSLVRQQLAPSRFNRPSLPERYRVADDLRRPLADVVAAAEQEAITAPAGQRWAPMDTNAASQPATNVEPYIRADGTRIWSVMWLERRLRPEAFDRRRGGCRDRRRTRSADASSP